MQPLRKFCNWPRRALVSGTKLGPYKIIELLGIGGMGEVYRAKDTRLERTVAINLRTMIGNEAQDAIRVRMKQIIPEYAYTPAAPWAESSTSMMLPVSVASADSNDLGF